MRTFDPQGKRFLVFAFMLAAVGMGVMRGTFGTVGDVMRLEIPALGRVIVLCLVVLGAGGIGVACILGAKKCVDKYADRRPR